MRGETQFDMPLAGRNRFKHQQFEVFKAAPLKVPFGELTAIRVDRISTQANSRQLSMWFSPELDYQLVKLRQTEPDGKHYEIQLESFTQSKAPVSS